MDLAAVTQLPLITPDLPGIGGKLKCEPADFEVEEIPAYPASGQGDFLYLWIEKCDLGAEYFQRQVARRLGLQSADIGMAGLKDRRAITRQWVSVPLICEDRLPGLEGEGIKLLRVERHGNKLKPGHLRGNRFQIRLRDVQPESASTLAACLQRLRETGLPNYFGSQRFGQEGETLRMGLDLIHGRSTPGVPRPRSGFLRKLAVSAVQSGLFNLYLGRRVAEGLLQKVIPGDVMAKWPVGGMFRAEDGATEQSRFDRREIVHAGPMFGRKLFPAAEEAAAREAAVLQEQGLTQASFAGFGKLLQGTRRHNLIYIEDLEGCTEGLDALLSFTLPAGSYATVVLREIMKTAADSETQDVGEGDE